VAQFESRLPKWRAGAWTLHEGAGEQISKGFVIRFGVTLRLKNLCDFPDGCFVSHQTKVLAVGRQTSGVLSFKASPLFVSAKSIKNLPHRYVVINRQDAAHILVKAPRINIQRNQGVEEESD
jgi:hypothetical protein